MRMMTSSCANFNHIEGDTLEASAPSCKRMDHSGNL